VDILYFLVEFIYITIRIWLVVPVGRKLRQNPPESRDFGCQNSVSSNVCALPFCMHARCQLQPGPGCVCMYVLYRTPEEANESSSRKLNIINAPFRIRIIFVFITVLYMHLSLYI
jgi:hypothetical protein